MKKKKNNQKLYYNTLSFFMVLFIDSFYEFLVENLLVIKKMLDLGFSFLMVDLF